MPIIGQISVGDGATFTPSVSSAGELSWTNNKNLPNPESVDIAQAVVDAGSLDSRYLQLSGGTMTGSNAKITMSNGESYIMSYSNGLYFGGTDGSNSTNIALFTNTNGDGFQLNAGNGTTYKRLVGKPDGTLTWVGKDVITAAGGTITGNVYIGGDISRTTNNSRLSLNGGNGLSNGAYLNLYGKDHTNTGLFSLTAFDGTTQNQLIGKIDGTLTWVGKNVERVNASGTNYIRYESGLQICWGSLDVPGATVSDATATLPQAFKSSTSYNIVMGRYWAYSKDENYIIKSQTATNFVWSTIGTVTNNSHSYRYVAIGFWK